MLEAVDYSSISALEILTNGVIMSGYCIILILIFWIIFKPWLCRWSIFVKIDTRSKMTKHTLNYLYHITNSYLVHISLSYIRVLVDNSNRDTQQPSRTVLKTLNEFNHLRLNSTQIITFIVLILKVTETPRD